ncbi:MAG: cardiolipin synthase [Rhizobiaceae bacterium]
MDTLEITVIVTVVAFAVGIVCALIAIWESRTSQGAIAWAISLITVPFLSVPLYLVFGRRRFRGYVRERRVATIESRVSPDVAKKFLPGKSTLSRFETGQIRMAEALADLPFTKGNDIRLLIDGRATFDAIFAAIDQADSYVLVQFYIVRDDGLGNELGKRLIAAVRRGVRTHLLYDEIGSGSTSKSYFQKLRDAGVRVSEFGSARGRFNRFQINFRNHRKIVVVDGHVGFIGGSNVGDEYLGLDPKFGSWRDTHAELRGPIVMAAQLTFQEDWAWATGDTLDLEWIPTRTDESDQVALVLSTGPADQNESCSLFFVLAINAAVDRVWIVSPYFVPDIDVITALKLAALRGVDVRIMVPDNPDHLIVWLAAFSYFEELREDNVQFYRYTKGFLHQKVMLIDHNVSAIGTANLDNRSFRLNFEITTLVIDEGLAAQVEEMLENDFSNCREYSKSEYDSKPFWFKLGVRMSRLASPVL